MTSIVLYIDPTGHKHIEPTQPDFKTRPAEIKAKYNHVFKRALYVLILLPCLTFSQPPPPGMNKREMDSLKRVSKDTVHKGKKASKTVTIKNKKLWKSKGL